MYIPKLFQVTDQATIHDLIERFSFATLVTSAGGTLTASHLPFLLDRNAGEHGTLLAHMARANSQWQEFEAGAEALVIFQGEHGYISPSWYEVHPSVPTWNYEAVHAYGVPHVIDEPERVRSMLERLVTTHESGSPNPWIMDLPEDYLSSMVRGIVAFEIPISRLEGKRKMSQNRPEVDRPRIIEALEASGDPERQRLAEAMREALSSTAS